MKNMVSFSLKQAKKISANGAKKKKILFSLWIKIIFLTPLADIFACFKQKLTTFWFFDFFRKQDLIS